MIPEEKHEGDVWEILQKIKMARLQSKYDISLVKWNLDHDNELENNLITQLEHDEIIKSIDDPVKWITDFEINQIGIPNLVKHVQITDFSYYLPSSSRFSNIIFLEILPKFYNVYDKYQAKFIQESNDKILTCGLLKVDIEDGVIQYGKREPLEVSLDNQLVKFLLILMKNKRVIEYVEIAKKTNMGLYKNDTITNKEVARDVQYLRRDLGTFLKESVGMPKDEINKMIINKKNIGYKIISNSASSINH